MDTVELWQGDCLDLMERIPTGTVDMVLADLPYGTTSCAWDAIIPFEPLWAHYRRVLKPGGAIVLTASQPFTTVLIASNLAWFRYCWVWDKVGSGSGFAARSRPLKIHEDIAVFCSGRHAYNPQMVSRQPRKRTGTRTTPRYCGTKVTVQAAGDGEWGFPKTILTIPNTNRMNRHHETEKPVALGEYLIRTYTNEGETVLDNTMGSGSFGVAAVNTGRRFVGIELDRGHFATAERRLAEAAEGKRQRESRPVVTQERLF